MGKSKNPTTLDHVLETQKSFTEILEKTVKTIEYLNGELKKLRSEHDRRIKAIEKKLAKSGVLPEKEQGPDEWREIMKTACRRSRGVSSVLIPWDQINNAKKFKKWFETDVRRYIVNGKVGNKYPPKGTNLAVCEGTPFVVDPADIPEFN